MYIIYNLSRFRVVKSWETLIETSYENFYKIYCVWVSTVKILFIKQYCTLTNKRNLNRMYDKWCKVPYTRRYDLWCVGNAAACKLATQYPQFLSEIKMYLVIFEPDVKHMLELK